MTKITIDWLLYDGFNDDGYGEYSKDNVLLDGEYTDAGVYNLVINGEWIKEIETIEDINNIEL